MADRGGVIDASQVAVVVVTRGDVDLAPVLEPYVGFGFADGYVWNNSGGDDDLGVYGRYAAIAKTAAPVVLVQDDDCVLARASIRALLDAYRPGTLVANMPSEFRKRYGPLALVGFGAVFDRDLPAAAFARFRAALPGFDDEMWRRRSDIVFAALTETVLVDVPYTNLPYAYGDDRMYRQPGHSDERDFVLAAARSIQ